jgi:hypothetical protein
VLESHMGIEFEDQEDFTDICEKLDPMQVSAISG